MINEKINNSEKLKLMILFFIEKNFYFQSIWDKKTIVINICMNKTETELFPLLEDFTITSSLYVDNRCNFGTLVYNSFYSRALSHK